MGSWLYPDNGSRKGFSVNMASSEPSAELDALPVVKVGGEERRRWMRRYESAWMGCVKDGYG